MEHNQILDQLYERACAYHEKECARDSEVMSLTRGVDVLDYEAYDAAQAKAHAAQEKWLKENPVPFTDGEYRALRMYERNLDRGADRFEVDDVPWECDLPDFIALLRKAGIDEICLTEESTALLRTVIKLEELGCTYSHSATVIREKDVWYGSKEPRKVAGISFIL